MIEVDFQFYKKYMVFFSKSLTMIFFCEITMFCQNDDPYAQQQPREKHLAIFYNLNHSKVKIYSYDALKKVLPKNHDKEFAKFFL